MESKSKTELLNKIVRAEAAMNAGRLEEYVVAKSADDSAPPTQNSWGPAMRI